MAFAIAKDNSRIYYECVGESDSAVILVQGLGLSGRFWFSVPQQLANDPHQPRQVITVDNRGSGRSDISTRPWSMKTMADDIVRVMDAAGVKKASIVGISMGGMIAQHVAIHYPERVNGLVLLATLPGWPHARPASLSTMYKLVSMPFVNKKGMSALAELLLPANAQLELLQEWPAAMRAEPTSPRGFVRQLAAVCTHVTPLALGKIRCPTFIVAADQDKVVPMSNARALARLIPGAKLQVIANCAHAIPVVDPDVIARCLALVLAQSLSDQRCSCGS